MLEIAEQIHCNIPIVPNAFLGITVCAVGTSFPNAVASILMAQQNKPAAAIANALGSNEQNVEGITEGVFWMMATLVLVVFFVIMPGFCTLSRANGIVLLIVYVCYLTLTCGETFKWWPPLMN